MEKFLEKRWNLSIAINCPSIDPVLVGELICVKWQTWHFVGTTMGPCWHHHGTLLTPSFRILSDIHIFQNSLTKQTWAISFKKIKVCTFISSTRNLQQKGHAWNSVCVPTIGKYLERQLLYYLRDLDLLRLYLELQAVLNCLIWVLGIEIVSSARAACIFHHRAFSPAPLTSIFEKRLSMNQTPTNRLECLASAL